MSLVLLREVRPLPRLNWSRSLPRTLTIPGVMKLKTLADVRALIGHLPRSARARLGSTSGLNLIRPLPVPIQRAFRSHCKWCLAWSVSNVGSGS